MGGGNRVCASSVAAFLVLLLSAPASAPAKGSKPITGKLSKPGYTVIALGANGRAISVQVEKQRFKLRPPAKRVTLHLRTPDGIYGGPIVVGRMERGKVAILGVEAGAKLGRVELKVRKGYAKVKRKLAERWIDATRKARAKQGVPIGAGKLGLVRSKHTKGGAPGDSDLDGVPDTLDIDDDGDLILDGYDPSTNARASGVALQSARAAFFSVNTTLSPLAGEAVNVNGGSSDQQIAAAQQNSERVGLLWGGVDPGSAEINCGTLVYCSAGGTGRYLATGFTPFADALPFPACCDPDGDGLGSLLDTPPSAAASDFHGMGLFAGASANQLGAGDVLIERATSGGTPVELVSSMGFVFSTYPVFAAYDDGQGDSGTFSYPNAQGPIPVRAGPSGDVVVKLTFWRPQRRRIAGEPGQGEWMDLGHLDYTASARPPFSTSPSHCPLSSYSDIDPNLTAQPSGNPLPPGFEGSHLEDLKGDQPSSPANTFTYTLNLTACLASNGLSMSTTEPTAIEFQAFANSPPSLASASFGSQFQLQP